MNSNEYNRKKFFQQCASAAGLLTLAGLSQKATAADPGKRKLRLHANDRILFTGDSITDGARERDIFKSPNVARAMGSGYAMLTAARLLVNYPHLDLKIHNTGINGDTIDKLLLRWDTECLALKPTVVSLLVGVNDFNLAHMATGAGDPGKYERQYRELLQKTITALPGVRLVIGEPYAIKGAREKIDAWYPSFNEYRAIARRIAAEFNAFFIPYQTIYDKKSGKLPVKYLSTDGIHPTLAGVQVMSDAWYDILS